MHWDNKGGKICRQLPFNKDSYDFIVVPDLLEYNFVACDELETGLQR